MPLPTLEECRPGLSPMEYNVVIAAEEVETKTKGGIILTDTYKEQNTNASMIGRLVAVSPLAFNFDNWPEGSELPKPGNRVLFAKFAGVVVNGDDGREYRVCKDKDVMAVFDTEAANV